MYQSCETQNYPLNLMRPRKWMGKAKAVPLALPPCKNPPERITMRWQGTSIFSNVFTNVEILATYFCLYKCMLIPKFTLNSQTYQLKFASIYYNTCLAN